MNVVVLEGRLSGPPQERMLASGTRVLSLQLTIDRRDDQRAAESVPVAWFDPKVSQFDFEEDQRLVVVGRVVRRFFQTASGLQSRTEVVAERVIPAAKKASIRTALASVVEQIADGMEPGTSKASKARARTGRQTGPQPGAAEPLDKAVPEIPSDAPPAH